VNVTIVGGSAHSTPALFETEPALGAERFSFALVGRDARRLAAVRRASMLVGAARGQAPQVAAYPFAALDAALEGADVVLVQIRVGGYAGRTWDETFPHRYELCGDEGLGAGGLAAAWRTWLELEAVLAVVARVSPAAQVLLMTSPVGILTRCALDAFAHLRIAGICELPWTTFRDACAAEGVDGSAATFDYAGVNHLGWIDDLRIGTRTLVTRSRPLGLKYLRLHDEREAVLREQRVAPPRAGALAQLAARAIDAYEGGDSAAIRSILRERSTPWYDEAVGPLLNALESGAGSRWFFLTTRNSGYLDWIDGDDAVEVPHAVRAGRLVRAQRGAPLRDDLAATLARLAAYERAAARAVRRRSRREVAEALRLHPWLDGRPVSDELVADVVAAIPAGSCRDQPTASATGPM
jgi:6-phospho-beta-glucosidase